MHSITAQITTFVPDHETVLSTSYGDDLLAQCSRKTPEKVKRFWYVKRKDLDAMHSVFLNLIAMQSEISSATIVNDLNLFGYQYLGITIKRKRFIYINAFYYNEEFLSSYLKDWETKPIVMCDGGHYYWGVLFDVAQQTFSQLTFNTVP